MTQFKDKSRKNQNFSGFLFKGKNNKPVSPNWVNKQFDELLELAGYPKEMQDFLNSNSGITSRIGYTLEFDDYTTDELIEIFKGFI